MNIIRNLNDNARTWAYAIISLLKFTAGVFAVVIALRVLEYFYGYENAWIIFACGMGVYIAITMSFFTAKSKVANEQRQEREIIRRLQDMK